MQNRPGNPIANGIRNVLNEDRAVISYRPRFNTETGSVTATILLQQIAYRYSRTNAPFYKFKEPCSHDLYREGDSWVEELGFTRSEFDLALNKIGQRITTAIPRDPNALVWHWITTQRVTYYELNIEAYNALICRLYADPDQELRITDSSDVSSRDPALRIADSSYGKSANQLHVAQDLAIDIYTKNTTENTTENTTTNTSTKSVEVLAADPTPIAVQEKLIVTDEPSKQEDRPNVKKKETSGRAPVSPHKDNPAVLKFKEYHKRSPNRGQMEVIANAGITDLDKWLEVMIRWNAAGYNPVNIDGQINWYKQGIQARKDNNNHANRKPLRIEAEKGKQIFYVDPDALDCA